MKTQISKKIIMALAAYLLSLSSHAQVVDSMKMPGMEIKSFSSKILGEKRKIRIQTPAGMNAWDAYPVLYILDGEVQTTMIAGQVQYLSESYRIIPNLIVVGIENTDRTRDLTPTHSIIGPDGKPDTTANAFGKNSGGGEKFLQFMKEELLPYIQQQYHPAPYTILSGHSLGGLMAVYCLINHPSYFNAYIAISPSLQWDDKVILKQAAQKQSTDKYLNQILFFSDANEDSAFHQNQIDLEMLLKQVNSRGLKLTRAFYPNETHTSEPVKAFYDGIRFIYPNWPLAYNNAAFKKTMNSQLIRDHFAKLSDAYNYKVVPLHDELILIGRFLRNDPKRIQDAIELLQWNAENYPGSAVNWETLGDTYMKLKDEKNASAMYQKASVLAPANANLTQKLNGLVK